MRKKFGNMKFGRPYRAYIRRKDRRRYSRIALVILIVSAVTYCIFSAMSKVYPVIEDVSGELLRSNSTEIINTSVLRSIEDKDIYNDLVNITYDESGNITSLTTNSTEINKLKSTVALDILNGIEQFGIDGFAVPLGNLTDLVLLSGVGPRIPFRVIPYGSVKVDFRSEFTDAGINQTLHRIYIDVNMNLHAVSVVSQIKTNVSTSILAAETVIVGDVPQVVAQR
ncbi:MAG: sporulation protein YunB [Clostridia bacterium]|nr:sporulation protein YunB [Clostridia bacterium]